MSGIKFYSEHDVACTWELEKIVSKIKNKDIDFDWVISDLLDFHNVIKYLNVCRFNEFIQQETGIDTKTYEQKLKQKIGQFTGRHKKVFINLYDEVDFDVKDDFFEVLESYKLYKEIEVDTFRRFIEREKVFIPTLLKFKRMTEYFDEAVKAVLLSDVKNAETILSKYSQEDDLYLPPSLNETNILSLIDEYIDSPIVHINILREIINFPSKKGLKIPDKIKLNAKRRAKKETEKIFNEETSFVSGVRISYPNNQKETILVNRDDRITDIKVSRKWIEDNIDYPTLWNNFIYLFEFVDESMRLNLVSKKSESSALESLIRPQGKYLYYQSFSFNFKEMLSNAEMCSYVNVLNIFGVRLEEMIEWFFLVYLKEEF